jgi:predicted Zn-dependent protease
MTDVSNRWPARHFDGETPAPRNVVVSLEAGTLVVAGDAMEARRWPLESVVLMNEGRSDGRVQLELRGERNESLLVTGGGSFVAALREAGGGRKPKRMDPPPMAPRIILALTVLAVILLFVGWRWGVPMLAAMATERVPESWERELGKAALEEIAPESLRVDDPVIVRPVEDTFTRLLAASTNACDSCEVHVLRSKVVNAYALPGGQVVVTTAILRALGGPEELAAVLAHEITHATKRHALRGMLQGEGLRLLFSLISGDDSALRAISGTAGVIGELSYSRSDETEADVGAADLLARSGISPLALARVQDRLSAKGGGRAPFEFLSTHPATATRRERARELSETLHVAPAEAPPDTASWRSMEEALAEIPD